MVGAAEHSETPSVFCTLQHLVHTCRLYQQVSPGLSIAFHILHENGN